MSEQSIIKKLLVGKNLKVTLIRGAILVLCVYLFQAYLFIPFRTTGISMEPTMKDGKIGFANAFTYRLNEPQRGDIVLIRLAGKKVGLIKRIIGLPGEKLRVEQGQLYINNQPLTEDYLSDKGIIKIKDQKIGANEYFVLGDNRLLPVRNMVFGKVHKKRIMGKYE